MRRNNRITGFICVALLAALASITAVQPAAAQGRNPVKMWDGKVADKAKRDLEPANGFIADEGTWKLLWKAWRDGPPPKVDFKQYVVLVGTAPGPNRVTISIKNGKPGDLKVTAFGTEIAGPGFGYRLIRWQRTRYKTINGKPIDGPQTDL